MLGLGAAAAALAPVKAVDAAEHACDDCSGYALGQNVTTQNTAAKTIKFSDSADTGIYNIGAPGGPRWAIDGTDAGPATQDDTAYLQGRIDQAKASGGGVIALEPRVYRISRTLDFTNARNVTMIGGRFIG